jgi:diketogulonate reductase-like aldo/keto reductase
MTELVLPKLGLGTWTLKPKNAKFSTIEGIKIGYRFIDTAQAYGNEAAIGEGLQEVIESGLVKRDEIILATKIHPLNSRPKLAYKSTISSLKKLKTDYIDILYVHWPAFVLGYSHEKTMKAFSQLIDEGKVRYIGVSNYTQQMIEDVEKVCDKPIFANQIEHHPYLQQNTMVKYLKEKDIHLISYSPLGRGKALDDPTLNEIANRNNISVAQVCLVWVMSKGGIPIPKATSKKHLEDNFASLTKSLSEKDIKIIDKIAITKRIVNPIVVSPKEWVEE